MTLLEIAKKYPTSKNDHGFIEIYHKYFSNLKEHKINILEIGVDQSDYSFLQTLVNKYGKFDIIIDDGSHQSKHIISSFNFLFNHLSDNGIYVVEDLQTSYQPRYGGSRFNLNKNKTSMGFLKSLADSINYEHRDKPFFKKNTFDGCVKSISFYQNIAFIIKGKSAKYFFNDIKKVISAIKTCNNITY